MKDVTKDLTKINDINKEEKEGDLLKDAPDYEDYTDNVVQSKGCGGCSKTKSSASNSTGGCCSTGGGCCSSGGGCCKK
ncbi:hypothetical protein ACQPU1_13815 [Clostridium paraputrificum]|uniref:hypothetical protein n=1 Tax=Clostridium TaxID=1485 RepID=UPI003D339C4C